MPTYEYECDACGHEFEEFQSMTAKPIKKCPKCGKLKIHRLIGAGAAVIFKGSGFYQTDYRSKEYKEKAKAESTPAGSGKTESPKAETAKPDKKPSPSGAAAS